MYYHFEPESQHDLGSLEITKTGHRKRLELADPYFLTYQRLRSIDSVEIRFQILTCPFQTKRGDFIV